ncbi:DUF4305 domain-containing protein [Fictibacillus enclensis]|uniref:DUF4305 domain-containing protein n=1 Tax=Fictibacillus enclensis TaxID=1017270 RepID=UPI0024BF48CB|nr:DUF4305 domain-containing protein [Fictibacillus enclensis]WHY72635.1 DUF4305 domain-containing protein [Fictibacillus enclensis]
MRTSPFFMSGLYTVMGVLFTWLAIHYSTEYGVTGIWTLITMLVATFDFANAIKYYRLHRHIKKYKK